MQEVKDIDVTVIVPHDREPLSFLTEDEYARLRSTYKVYRVERQEVIYSEGDDASDFYFVADGKIKIYKNGFGGKKQIVKLANRMDVIGYRAILAGEAHSACAAAITDCIVVRISGKIMMEIIQQNTAALNYIVRHLAQELRASRRQSMTISQKQLHGRLAEGLLMLKEKYGYEQGTKTIHVDLTREDMASLCSMTTANAIRTLKDLAQDGVISISAKRRIEILDEERLQKISDHC